MAFKIVPVWDPALSSFFLEDPKFHRTVEVTPGVSVTTAPLRTNVVIELLALSDLPVFNLPANDRIDEIAITAIYLKSGMTGTIRVIRFEPGVPFRPHYSDEMSPRWEVNVGIGLVHLRAADRMLVQGSVDSQKGYVMVPAMDEILLDDQTHIVVAYDIEATRDRAFVTTA